MNQDNVLMQRLGKAVAIVARRLRNKDGNFDIEACWAIGVLSTVAEMDLADLPKTAETYSRVVFTSAGPNKIKAMKCVRIHLACLLKDSKDIVEGTIHGNALPEVAQLIKEECEELGSKVVIHPWILNNPVIGRGLDLDDEPPIPDMPF